MKTKISVNLKPGILDPQGKAVLHAIDHLGYTGVDNVRIGKYIEIEFSEKDPEKVRRDVEMICQKLLANPVMENYHIEIEAES